jgi:peptide/nickel transport system substrate-binding protein
MRRTTATAAVAVLAAAALAACNANPKSTGTAGATTAPVKGGTLDILSSATTVTLDPAKSQNLAITTLGLMQRRLTEWDIEPGKPASVVPDLATDTGRPSDGGKTWTYTLKDGLKFSDGTPITAADVKYGVERSFAPELSGGLGYHKGLLVGGTEYKGPFSGGQLASIETPDTRTVVFHLDAAYGDWPWIVSMPAFAPVPNGKGDPATYSKNPTCSGPYMVDSYQQGSSLKLKRNPYWDAKSDPYRHGAPDSVVFLLGQNTTVTAQRLIADSGDDKNAFSATFVPPAQLAQVEQNAAAKQRLVTSDSGALEYLAINTQRPALKDVRVRQAINYAVDKKSVQVAAGGPVGGDIASTLITPGIPGRVDYNLYQAPDTGDVDKAKQLLAQAGHATDLNLTLLVSNGEAQNLGYAQAIQQGLARAGITVQIKAEDDDTWQADATGDKANYDLSVSGWQPDFPSANGNIEPLFASREIGGGGYNISRYSSPDADALIQTATAETDPAKAQADWVQADKRIMQDAPIVPLLYTKNSFLHGSNVRNFYVASFPAYPNYLTVSLAK